MFHRLRFGQSAQNNFPKLVYRNQKPSMRRALCMKKYPCLLYTSPEGPFVTSGMRVGTPAVTTRGFGEPEMVRIAQFIWQAATDFDAKADEIRRSVCEMVAQFPIYGA